ncbi:phosphate signaling complex protein PhoU [Methanolobus profundi]|uniref:Phosphate-specific transport system accessory protein PhoU n=1 Tax=Methanolobus profundi TaxID=487685 RepID=A0A1I4SNS7_9EURY|nr:phosphate signaling complex protein PhoU [Methanolobus profundi]SFM66065.1 phosphate uptake regulator, PhoU [Methanolobus profundi]
MARDQFQQNMETLKGFVIEMGELARNAIVDSMQVLRTQDAELAEKIFQGDELIDEYELKIEKCSTQLISRQNPTAGDMRLVVSCFKIAIDLERMSDLAVDIANVAKCMEKNDQEALENILKMAELCDKMLQRSIKAFETLDKEMAYETATKDDEIDRLFYKTQSQLIEKMIGDKSIITSASHLLLVLRYLERCGDHTCNICESIVYIASGQRVKLN